MCCRVLFAAVAIGTFALSAAAEEGPDVLVVCPAEFRAALAPWEAYRRSQGHRLSVVEPSADVAELQATVRRVARSGELKFLVLVGDVPTPQDESAAHTSTTVPTNYVRAHVNTQWGSEPWIATDQLHADVDGDGIADVAVGRIPADTPAELATVVRKVLRYEQQADCGLWQRRIDVVAGAGGFGPVADALVEAAGRQVFRQTIPAGYVIDQTSANPRSPRCPPPGELRPYVRGQFAAGSLAWVYLGHGRATELDVVPEPTGERPVLSVHDVSQLACGAESPLAVLIACYAGAVDAPQDCLAEELLLADGGPVAVVAATRVTMPYGNTVVGYELLRTCFQDQTETVGEMLRLAQARTVADAPDDVLRRSLDGLARGISPRPAQGPSEKRTDDLAAERREHAMMYHLLGDPLLRVRRPRTISLATAKRAVAGDAIQVTGRTDVAGECLVELVPSRDRQQDERPLPSVVQHVGAGTFQVSLTVPQEMVGACTVRAFVTGEQNAAVGATQLEVTRPASERVAQGGQEQRRR